MFQSRFQEKKISKSQSGVGIFNEGGFIKVSTELLQALNDLGKKRRALNQRLS